MGADPHERIIRSTTVFAGRLLTLTVEDVALADGASARREIVYHPGAVAIVPLTDEGEVVLVRQFRLAAGRVLLEIPAGVLHAGETPQECARRELAEEVGLRPERLELLTTSYLAPGYSSEVIHLFEARDLHPAFAEADADERIERVDLPLSDALDAIGTGEIGDAKTIAGLLLVARRSGGYATARTERVVGV